MNSREIGDKLRQHFKDKGITQTHIAEVLDVSQSYVNSLLSGKKAFGKKNAQLFGEKFNLSPIWLLTGEGDMLSCGVSSVGKSPSVSGRTIRYWADINATGGGNEIFTDSDTARIIKLEIPEFRDCTDAVNIYGDSMSPIYKSGQIILLRKWEESYIEYGNTYLVITKGGHRMVKILDKSESEENVTCISANPKFSPFEVKKEDIISLWLVKGSICKSNM